MAAAAVRWKLRATTGGQEMGGEKKSGRRKFSQLHQLIFLVAASQCPRRVHIQPDGWPRGRSTKRSCFGSSAFDGRLTIIL